MQHLKCHTVFLLRKRLKRKTNMVSIVKNYRKNEKNKTYSLIYNLKFTLFGYTLFCKKIKEKTVPSHIGLYMDIFKEDGGWAYIQK